MQTVLKILWFSMYIIMYVFVVIYGGELEYVLGYVYKF